MKGLKLGDFEIFWLNGGEFELDGGTMFGVVPKTLWLKKYTANGNKNVSHDNDHIKLLNAPLLIKTPDALVLIERRSRSDVEIDDVDFRRHEPGQHVHRILLCSRAVRPVVPYEEDVGAPRRGDARRQRAGRNDRDSHETPDCRRSSEAHLVIVPPSP